MSKIYIHKTNYRGKCWGWNRGQTKETSDILKKAGEKYSEKIRLGIIIPGFKNKHHSEISRKKISDGMKKAHSERRANPWKPKFSYAQNFFEKFLINEGFIKERDFFCEFPFGRYRLDFFFPEKSLAIEIDGYQHYRYKHIQEKDKIRDAFLKSKNVETLRIIWKIFYSDTKNELNKIKDIIIQYDKKYDVTSYYDIQLKKLNMIEELQKRQNLKKYDIKSREVKRAEKIDYLRKQIVESGIDLTRVGCLKQLAKIVGKHANKTAIFLRKYMPDIKFRTLHNKKSFE